MATNWKPEDMPDLHGKVAVVTGSNHGVGLHTAKHLALHGARVYMATRSREKATDARKELLSENPSISEDQLVLLQLDLSSTESTLDAIQEVKAKETKVDILVNNAGIVDGKPSQDGKWNEVMAVDYINHFVFTNGLFPLLKNACSEKGADVRILTLSSDVQDHFFPKDYPFDFESPLHFYEVLPYYPWQWRYIWRHFFQKDMVLYSMAKLADLLFIKELQKRVDEQGLPIICISLNPGMVNTPRDHTDSVFRPLLQKILRWLGAGLTPDQGSYNSLFSATAVEVREKEDQYKGSLLFPVGVITPPHYLANDDKALRALWDTTTKEVNSYLAKQGKGPLPEWK